MSNTSSTSLAISDPFGDPTFIFAFSIGIVNAATRRAPSRADEESPSEQENIDSLERVRQASQDRRRAECLLREILPRVRNLVRYLVRDDIDVDDIAQEALFAVLRGLSSYQAKGRFESWVDRIVARVTFAQLSKRRRSPDRPAGWEPNLSSLPSPASNPDFFERRWLVSLLDQLPDTQRHALVMHHVMELTVPDIATELNISVETVRSRLRLGRKRLRLLVRGDPKGHV